MIPDDKRPQGLFNFRFDVGRRRLWIMPGQPDCIGVSGETDRGSVGRRERRAALGFWLARSAGRPGVSCSGRHRLESDGALPGDRLDLARENFELGHVGQSRRKILGQRLWIRARRRDVDVNLQDRTPRPKPRGDRPPWQLGKVRLDAHERDPLHGRAHDDARRCKRIVRATSQGGEHHK